MASTQARKLFVNLAVRDLERSRELFTTLGFKFDPKFSDAKAACMIVSDEAYVMLLTEPFFKSFTNRDVCDTTRTTEGLFALSCDSREEVSALVEKAIAAGGSHAMDPVDHGMMYGWSFYDLDGHHWELVREAGLEPRGNPTGSQVQSPPRWTPSHEVRRPEWARRPTPASPFVPLARPGVAGA